MERPDEKSTRIKEAFLQKFQNSTRIDELEQLKLIGKLIFTEEDVNSSPWPPDRLLRRLFVDNRITDAYFNEKYKLYAYVKLGLPPSKASNNRTNILKALKKGHITYNKLIEVISNILGYEITDMILVFNDPCGRRQKIELKEEK